MTARNGNMEQRQRVSVYMYWIGLNWSVQREQLVIARNGTMAQRQTASVYIYWIG